IQLDMKTCRRGFHPEVFDYGSNPSRGVEPFHSVGLGACFHAAEVEQGLDEPLQPSGGSHLLLIVAGKVRGILNATVTQQFTDLAERCQRSAKLMGHSRNEVGLQTSYCEFACESSRDEVAACGDNQQEQAQSAENQPTARCCYSQVRLGIDA